MTQHQYVNGMSIDLFSSTSRVALTLSVLLLIGCGGEGQKLDVPAGQFKASVKGAISDTLSGPVHYRARGDSLVGLELGMRTGPGLSIELEPHPPALRTYEVVTGKLFGTNRSGSTSDVMAFLATDEAQFEATGGSLELTYVDDEQVGATFTFEMEGEFAKGPSESPAVEVTGALNAPPER